MDGVPLHHHAAEDVSTGTIDGDRLPAMSATKQGAVPATGAPSGKVLKDDGTWGTGGGGTTDHAALTNKDYASAGHTGFAPSSHTHGGGDVTSAVAEATHATSADSATTAGSATTAASADAVAWANVSGKPTTFAPSSHDNTAHSTAYAANSDLTTHTGYTTTAHGGLLPSSSFSGLAKITVSTTAPVGPSAGDLWIDTA